MKRTKEEITAQFKAKLRVAKKRYDRATQAATIWYIGELYGHKSKAVDAIEKLFGVTIEELEREEGGEDVKAPVHLGRARHRTHQTGTG